jgi:putative flippase GtrA
MRLIHYLLARLLALPRILRFAFVGGIGFLVDSGVLYVAIYALQIGPYWGRVLSYLLGATSTWYFNRAITCQDARGGHKGKEWLIFVSCSLVAFGVNYLVYTSFLWLAGRNLWTPLVGVGLGSIAGLAVNYPASRYLVFRERREQHPG